MNMKIMFFTSHFFKVNISVNIIHSHFKFSASILTIIRERTVSQIFGAVFHYMVISYRDVKVTAPIQQV